jgi:hypothetical protein
MKKHIRDQPKIGIDEKIQNEGGREGRKNQISKT